jgi:predicted Zn-dependent protease
MKPKAISRGIVVLALFAFTSLGVGCASDKAVISQANQAHTGLQPAVMTDAELSGYIQRVGDRIIAAAKELNAQGYGPQGKEDKAWMFSKDMQFHFVNSKTLNAFTTGGEHMYIYTELFQQAKTEDELAAVMSHEFAHVYGRHVQKGMNRQYTILAAAAGGGRGGDTGGREGARRPIRRLRRGRRGDGGQFVGMSYTRGDEAEADKLGFAFYTHAGWDPNKFGDFFRR